MAIKPIIEEQVSEVVKTVVTAAPRGEYCTIRDVRYFIRYPKAKDMISLEKLFVTKDASSFTQALLMIQELSEDKSLTYEYLEDLYLDELTEALELFQKLLPSA